MLLTDSRFPGLDFQEFTKWRNTYEGGRAFINRYLKKFDRLETSDEFLLRSELTYCPSFAEEGIKEITNGIFPRLADITRTGGTASYNDAIIGNNGGVDLKFSSMNTFMGKQVLPEACIVGKVGIYVDMPKFNTEDTLADLSTDPHPYLYLYTAEQILSWSTTIYENELVYTAILIRDCYVDTNPETGLPTEVLERYRFIRLKSDGVHIDFYERYMEDNTTRENVTHSVHLKGLTRIPLVIVDFGSSFLKNVADYQIALLNIESSDIQYILKSNFPFYVEQYNPLSENTFGKQTKIDPVTGETTTVSGAAEVITGATKGRRYPMGADAPAFIHPSSEPLQASAAKQEQIKQDIRRLLDLAVSNVAPTRASAESKQVDQQGLEAGLAAIGIALETAERQIGQIWAQYENKPPQIVVKYPNVYSTKSDSQRIQDAKDIGALKTLAPSRTFGKELSKIASRSLLGGKVSQNTMQTIESEIDNAEHVTSDYKEIASDVENGLVDKRTASNARGYDGKKVVPIATQEHTERLAEIAKAQSVNGTQPISGVKDTQPPKRGPGK